eukprot:TRINITY_DN26607_c1_g2_i1.p1 TRINITY_DN26607_c1_g2~~TRINITY_DN26607_c1_g2_i1.p1  ORF type:complete len:200 (+),score=-15.09 TRINITY_DN26607_c1_g2_i1:281-880(+)
MKSYERQVCNYIFKIRKLCLQLKCVNKKLEQFRSKAKSMILAFGQNDSLHFQILNSIVFSKKRFCFIFVYQLQNSLIFHYYYQYQKALIRQIIQSKISNFGLSRVYQDQFSKLIESKVFQHLNSIFCQYHFVLFQKQNCFLLILIFIQDISLLFKNLKLLCLKFLKALLKCFIHQKVFQPFFTDIYFKGIQGFLDQKSS